MRNFAGMLLVAGIAGFFYAGSQLDVVEPVPEGTGIMKSLEYPAGRWETARAAAAAAGITGIVLLFLPRN